MPILFWDTETTGKAAFKKPLTDASQPDLVQLAAILTDDDLNEISTLNCIVHPTYWTISEEVSKIHGVTHEHAEACGITLPGALHMFNEFADIADRAVAHNSKYDVWVMARARARLQETPEGRATSKALDLDRDPFAGKEVRCTVMASTNVLKLKQTNPYVSDPYKYPKLEECTMHFFNEGIDGAHDAMVDVRACIRVYRELCKHYGMTP